ncbi:hypothetical protein ACHAW6_001404 [Cyclotella cf. meneghiniana]
MIASCRSSLLFLVILTASICVMASAFSPRFRSLISHSHTVTASKTSRLHVRRTTPYNNVKQMTIEGPPLSSKPDYSSIHGPFGPFIDRLLLILFRTKLSSRLSNKKHPTEIAIPDAPHPSHDYGAIIELTHTMNSQYRNRTAVQSLAQDVLISLFPSLILDRYPSWFARPFPKFSSQMCAYATVAFGTWLMGECSVNDIPSKRQGVLVKRCRFLEESQCASICVNSCKIPTQNFFRENMGLGLTMTPNYETGECQFAFGVLPSEEEERQARKTPCLRRCPSGGGMRSWHDGSSQTDEWLEDLNSLAMDRGSSCMLMDNLE